MSEFNLIKNYFSRAGKHTDLGVGDDAALLQVAAGMQLAISSDMLVAGTHFLPDCAPYDIGWKALAVNISDMAAMGALAKWATLAIALPSINDAWLAEFSRGFFACADAFNIDLIGGDTTRGPLNICVTIMGEVPIGSALKRSGAQAGDDIWVSGTLGDAALALAILQNRYQIDKSWLANVVENKQISESEKWTSCLHRPQPRAALGLALRGIATSCIDISDGLLSDLNHILTASNLGATIHLDQLPVSLHNQNHLHESSIQLCVLAGGDDYELCFTAPPNKREAIELIGKKQNIALTNIASTRMASNLNTVGLQALYKNTLLSLNSTGFDHFG